MSVGVSVESTAKVGGCSACSYPNGKTGMVYSVYLSGVVVRLCPECMRELTTKVQRKVHSGRVNQDEDDGAYFMFVDGMDGDLYNGSLAVGDAVSHALSNGAKDVRVTFRKK